MKPVIVLTIVAVAAALLLLWSLFAIEPATDDDDDQVDDDDQYGRRPSDREIVATLEAMTRSGQLRGVQPDAPQDAPPAPAGDQEKP